MITNQSSHSLASPNHVAGGTKKEDSNNNNSQEFSILSYNENQNMEDKKEDTINYIHYVSNRSNRPQIEENKSNKNLILKDNDSIQPKIEQEEVM